jgi:hypothetical protein
LEKEQSVMQIAFTLNWKKQNEPITTSSDLSQSESPDSLFPMPTLIGEEEQAAEGPENGNTASVSEPSQGSEM